MRSAAKIVRAAAAMLVLATGFVQAAVVGSKAPALQPQEWLNTKGAIEWKTLKGRVVLIEKWATY